MVSKIRKVLFYRLSLNDKQGKIISPKELEAKFDKIIQEYMIKIPNSNRYAISIEKENEIFVIELIKKNNKLAFLKLGIQNASNAVALRNGETLESDEVDIAPNQSLETYTYCLIDFATTIVSYVNTNTSPRISVLKDLFEKCYGKEGFSPSMNIIFAPDAIKEILKKKRVLKIQVDVAVPSDNVLTQYLEVSEGTFDGLGGKSSSTVSFQIKADRGKSLYKEEGKFNKILKELTNKAGSDRIQRIAAWGKDDNETESQMFDLLSYKANVKGKVGRERYDNASEEDQLNMIEIEYESRKEEILGYISIQ